MVGIRRIVIEAADAADGRQPTVMIRPFLLEDSRGSDAASRTATRVTNRTHRAAEPAVGGRPLPLSPVPCLLYRWYTVGVC